MLEKTLAKDLDEGTTVLYENAYTGSKIILCHTLESAKLHGREAKWRISQDPLLGRPPFMGKSDFDNFNKKAPIVMLLLGDGTDKWVLAENRFWNKDAADFDRLPARAQEVLEAALRISTVSDFLTPLLPTDPSLTRSKKERRKAILCALDKHDDPKLTIEESKDKNLILTMVKRTGSALRYADESLQGDRDVVLAAVQQDGNALRHATRELQLDRDMAFAAVCQDVRTLSYSIERFVKRYKEFLDRVYPVILQKNDQRITRHLLDCYLELDNAPAKNDPKILSLQRQLLELDEKNPYIYTEGARPDKIPASYGDIESLVNPVRLLGRINQAKYHQRLTVPTIA